MSNGKINNNNYSSNPEIDYQQLALDVFNEQNRVRTNPDSYIEKLERATKFFKDKIFRHPAELPIETYEGVQGILDAIEFLKKQKPVEALQYSGELSQACKDHAKDIGSKGLSSHEGSDGNGLSERIEKYIEWDGAVAENLDFCYKFAENIVMNLIVDDGSKEKHQRNNLFNPEFVYGVLDVMNIRLLKYVLCVIMPKVYIRLAKNLLMLLIQFRIIFKRQWEKIINQKMRFKLMILMHLIIHKV